jgi:hypothetical protein
MQGRGGTRTGMQISMIVEAEVGDLNRQLLVAEKATGIGVHHPAGCRLPSLQASRSGISGSLFL